MRIHASSPAWSKQNSALVDEGRRLANNARADGVEVRLLGGVAVIIHGHGRSPEGSRPVRDIDVIVKDGQGRRLSRILESLGYEPEARFNAVNGQRRMIFHGRLGELDVLVGTFEMCHRINFQARLSADFPTVTITDLLVTKLQVVRLNAKDASDIFDIVATHELGTGPGDHIEVDYLKRLVRDDWGLWLTIRNTLQLMISQFEDPRSESSFKTLLVELDRAPKTIRWKIRAQLGTRIPWYTLPDEVRE